MAGRRPPVSVPLDQVHPWTPQPGPQEKAIRASFVTEMLYGGGRGSGKTQFLLGDFAADIHAYGQNWRGLLFRRTYPELDEIIEQAKQIYYHAFPGAEYKVGSKTWHFPNGATLRLRHLEVEADADHYQGQQAAWIGFDEITQWPSLRAFHKLKACLRVGNIEIPTKRIRATGNPGGPGHSAVKSYFIDVAPEGEVYLNPEDGTTRMYIRGTVRDNLILMRNDPGYVTRLRGVGDGALVQAWLNGDWSVFVGQYFAGWRAAEIGVTSFNISSSWPLFGAMDYGEASPTAFALYAVDYDGVVYQIAEYYQANRSASQHARAIREMIEACPFTMGRSPQTIFCDPSMFTRRRLTETVMTSPADVFAAEGLFLTAANNDRVTGWRVCNDALIKQRFKAFIGWNDALFRTVPALPRDPKNPEDADSHAEDHMCDCWRYAMIHVYKPAAKKAGPGRDFTLGRNVLLGLENKPGHRRPKVGA